MTPLTPVPNSSLVAAFGYDAAAGVLALQLANTPGYVYHYRGVDADTAAAFEKAESKGKAYGALIRGKYDFARIDTTAEAESAEA